MAVFYFFIGIPGSGKSDMARRMAERGCVIVSPDTIREERGVRSPVAFEIARQEIAEALRRGQDVAFDATNTIRQYRAENIAAGRSYADRVVCVWFDIPLEVCVKRHLARMTEGIRLTLPVTTIERMAQQLADNSPDLTEGFDEIVRITLKDQRKES